MNLIEARRGKELKIRVTRDPWFAKEEKRIKTPEISARMDKAEGLLKKLDFDTLFDQFNDHYLEGRGSEFQVKSIHLFYPRIFPDRDKKENIVVLYKVFKNKDEVHIALFEIGKHDEVYLRYN